jgi:hypothetical protein
LTSGDLEAYEILTSWAVTLPAVLWILIRDEHRLRDDELARAWPPVSRNAALYTLWSLGLPQLAVPLHFIRTRQNARGVAVGIGWLAVLVGLQLGACWLLDLAVARFSH